MDNFKKRPPMIREKKGMTVQVRNNDVSGALRILKKRMQEEGIMNEMRERGEGFRSRGERKRLERAAGKRRHKKALNKRMDELGY